MSADPDLVTVVVPTLDEQDTIGACLDAILAQTHAALEVLVVDGGSTDRTAQVVAERAATDDRVRLVANPDRVIPAALNRGVEHARGTWLVRVDAHSTIPPDYVARAVDRLRAGRWGGVGGRKDAVATTPTGIAIAAALGSRFGVGGSTYHHGTEPRTVDHVPFGAYPLDLIRELGGWDEHVLVNEDYEFDARVRHAGRALLFDPALRIEWRCRETLRDLARQYHRYGRGKSHVARMYPAEVKLRHLAAPGLVAALAAGLVATPWSIWPLAAVVVAYVVALVGATALTAPRVSGWRSRLALAPAFATMHLAWGSGFWRGLLRAARGRDPHRDGVEQPAAAA